MVLLYLVKYTLLRFVVLLLYGSASAYYFKSIIAGKFLGLQFKFETDIENCVSLYSKEDYDFWIDELFLRNSFCWILVLLMVFYLTWCSFQFRLGGNLEVDESCSRVWRIWLQIILMSFFFFGCFHWLSFILVVLLLLWIKIMISVFFGQIFILLVFSGIYYWVEY